MISFSLREYKTIDENFVDTINRIATGFKWLAWVGLILDDWFQDILTTQEPGRISTTKELIRDLYHHKGIQVLIPWEWETTCKR